MGKSFAREKELFGVLFKILRERVGVVNMIGVRGRTWKGQEGKHDRGQWENTIGARREA